MIEQERQFKRIVVTIYLHRACSLKQISLRCFFYRIITTNSRFRSGSRLYRGRLDFQFVDKSFQLVMFLTHPVGYTGATIDISRNSFTYNDCTQLVRKVVAISTADSSKRTPHFEIRL